MLSSGIFFQVLSLVYMGFLILVYFSKRRLSSFENKLFIALMIVNMFGLCIDILSVITIANIDKIPIINKIVTKGYLFYLLIWIHIFTIYIFAISKKNDKVFSRQVKLIISVLVISLICVVIFPLNYEVGDIVYSYGMAATFTYVVSGLLILSWIFCMIINYKNLKQRKYLPLFTFMTIGIFAMILQSVYPGLLIMTSMETFVTFLMYFTIENPDMQLIDELNEAKSKADAANKAKSEFLSSMSHEIRTPLNAIVGFSQALLEEDLTDVQKEEANDIMMASNVLLELVNGILDISKIEANKIEIVNTKYKFREVFDDLVVLTKARLGDKKLDFRYFYDDSIPFFLYGDYTRIKQIILNLLTNAVKYTREGFVEFRVSSVIDNDICRLIVSVEDSGIGIKNENIDKLFMKFERLDLDKNITIEGTGLGLAITKKLIELMNGKIVVQSVYGKGSKFTVAIDQKIIYEDLSDDALDSSSQDLDVVEDTDNSKALSIDKNDDIEVLDDVVRGKPRVLIVDDNKLNLKVASRLLNDYDLDITLLNSGQECIDNILDGNKYDLIFLDDMMPKMSGVETLSNLKRIVGFNMPVIMLTANAITGMREKYLKEGFNDYLSKPINKIELNKIIDKYLFTK